MIASLIGLLIVSFIISLFIPATVLEIALFLFVISIVLKLFFNSLNLIKGMVVAGLLVMAIGIFVI